MFYRPNLIWFIFLSGAFILSPGDTIANNQEIPLDPEQWQNLRYSGINSNVVSGRDGTMLIQVNNSASPLIYPLQSAMMISELELRAQITGTLSLPDVAHQSRSEVDDFRLQVGLVYAGDTRMGFLQSMIAPDWLKTLFNLGAGDRGISRVEFYSTWLDPRLAGTEKVHGDRGLLHQHFALQVDSNGVIDQRLSVPTDEAVVAVWISSDGDGTGSAFEVRIDHIRLIGMP